MGRLVDNMRMLVIRLAEYDPVKTAAIEEQLTLTEIAEAYVVKVLDNWIEDDD